MITLNVDSLLASVETLKLKGLEMRAAARDQYRSQILEMFYQLLLVTPQYSSDMVFNWDIETDGSPDRSYERSEEKVEYVHEKGVIPIPPHHAGELDAGLLSAYYRGVSRMKYIKAYGQPVYFVNTAPLEIDSPIVVGADGVQELRDGSVIFAWVSITSYLQARFGGPTP